MFCWLQKPLYTNKLPMYMQTIKFSIHQHFKALHLPGQLGLAISPWVGAMCNLTSEAAQLLHRAMHQPRICGLAVRTGVRLIARETEIRIARFCIICHHPYLTLHSGRAALRPYQFGPMRNPNVTEGHSSRLWSHRQLWIGVEAQNSPVTEHWWRVVWLFSHMVCS